MDLTTALKNLELHKQPHRSDFPGFPFHETARLQMDDKATNYGCAFNQYAGSEDMQLVAICGDGGVHVFHIPMDSNGIKHVWGCSFDKSVPQGSDDKVERLFSVAWAYDTCDGIQGKKPYKIVTGGAGGHIYVIDYETAEIDNILRSFGGDINEIRVCPSDSNIIATACADESIRIHHIRNEGALITCGGLRTHKGSILSLDWHSSGDYLVSCGFDHQILKWDLSRDPAKSWLKKACTALEKGQRNIYFQSSDDVPNRLRFVEGMKRLGEHKDDEVIKEIVEASQRPSDNHLEIYTPTAICNDLHNDYIDCIRILPGSDVFVSKSTGYDPHIYVSKFGLPKGIQEFKHRAPLLEPEFAQTNFTWLVNPTGSQWFIKFAIDPRRRWIVCGGSTGEVHFYDMTEKDKEKKHHPAKSIIIPSNNTVRNLDFSTCGRVIIGCTNEGIIFRIDRISSSVDNLKYEQFKSLWNQKRN